MVDKVEEVMGDMIKVVAKAF